MQHICRGAGAGVLELSLPEEDEAEETQQQADLPPNGRGKHASVKAEAQEEVNMCFRKFLCGTQAWRRLVIIWKSGCDGIQCIGHLASRYIPLYLEGLHVQAGWAHVFDHYLIHSCCQCCAHSPHWCAYAELCHHKISVA